MLNMTLNRDRAEILKRRRYALAMPGQASVPVSPLGAYIQLDADDQLRMLKMKAGEEIDLRGTGGLVIKLRRTS